MTDETSRSPAGLVDVHAHFTTAGYIEAAKAAGHREADGMPEDYWPLWSADAHLELMGSLGIGKSFLSVSSPGVYFGDATAAVRLAREVNDRAAEVAASHPDSFGWFASLPMPDVAASRREAARALELKADGVVLMSNFGGSYFGDPDNQPLFEDLNARGAVVFLHPTSSPGHDLVDCGRPRPMIEFLFETARTITDFILSGSAARYPDLKIVVPHGSGVIPLLATRVEAFRSLTTSTPDGPSVAELLKSFYYDLAGVGTPFQVEALLTIADPGHILYGSDYPWTRAELAKFITQVMDQVVELPGGDSWREQTTHNAGRLFVNH
ncbi:amidohydrolase family protein [Mycobacterium sp. NPDC003449]